VIETSRELIAAPARGFGPRPRRSMPSRDAPRAPALFNLGLALVIPIGTIVLTRRSRFAFPSARARERPNR